MKTVWSGGDIITAEKLNNIEKNSQNNLMVCLNNYQLEPNSGRLNISIDEIQQLMRNKAFLYFYNNRHFYMDYCHSKLVNINGSYRWYCLNANNIWLDFYAYSNYIEYKEGGGLA